MSNATIHLEWFFDVLNKRLTQGIKIEDLFLCVPHNEECEFDFEISNVFKYTKNGIQAQGNNLERDYPELFRLIQNSNKKITIRVFFISYNRLKTSLVLWHKKYPYPKINKVKGRVILTESQYN